MNGENKFKISHMIHFKYFVSLYKSCMIIKNIIFLIIILTMNIIL